MGKLKICFVSKEYAHPLMGKSGGIGVFVRNNAIELVKRGVEVTIFSYGEKKQSFFDDGVSIYQIKDLSIINNTILKYWRTSKFPGYIILKYFCIGLNKLFLSIYVSIFVIRKKANIIEFNDYGADTPFFLGTITKVVRCHGSYTTLHKFMGYDQRKIDVFFEKIFFKRSKLNIVAVSQYSAQISKKAFNLVQLPTVIYNGLKISKKYGFEKKNKLNNQRVNRSIYFFGSINERKGILIACKVFNVIVKNYPDATFHILGRSINNYWEEVVVKTLTPEARIKTFYYGVVDNSKIYNYLIKAHVVLFPSYGENFSMALLETMSIGKLVVTSNIESFKEIIENRKNGFIAKNECGYIEIINTIFEKKINEEKISNKAIETIEKNFNIDNIICENIEYYKNLIH